MDGASLSCILLVMYFTLYFTLFILCYLDLETPLSSSEIIIAGSNKDYYIFLETVTSLTVKSSTVISFNCYIP